MVDYSRWDKIVEDEEKQEQSAKLVSDMLKIQKEKGSLQAAAAAVIIRKQQNKN